ncbi:MAG TPA: aldo/keto reductase, partial [Casimicrobiaceae bacterium]|nr:aldo/keto reductase [Casimicrobiaceae bacterium]
MESLAGAQPSRRGAGLNVSDSTWPRIGLGCASLGAPSRSNAEAEAVIVAAIDAGIRFFDVAPLYGGGLAEER